MKKIIIISIILIILILLTFRFFVLNKDFNEQVIETSNLKNYNLSDYINIDYYANVERYYVYGTHFNIEGTLNNIYSILEEHNIQGFNDVYFEMCLKGITDEIKYDLEYEINEENGSVKFMLSDKINKGIYLDNISNGEYALLLKLNYKIKNDYSNGDKTDCIYISFNLQNNYDDIEYYTITQDSQNKKILIVEEENDNNDIIKFTVDNTDIKDGEIFDITIDAGHGGSDPGAVKNDYYESNIVLDYALILKERLESAGLKVKLTRQSDEYVQPYGDGGRAVVPNEVKSKYCFSLHLNSNEETIYNGGIEIYCPNDIDYELADSLLENVLNKTNIGVSGNLASKIKDGIYVKNYTNIQIKEANSYAKELGYEAYNITTSTPYLFMIRETGGIATNAYMDGRNNNYDENFYCNSNQACESYLLELGYINSTDDLNVILEQKNEYVNALADAIINFVNK